MFRHDESWRYGAARHSVAQPHYAAQLFLTSGHAPETPIVGGRNYSCFKQKKPLPPVFRMRVASSFSRKKSGFVLAAQVAHHLLGLELDAHPLEQRLDDPALFLGRLGHRLELQAQVVRWSTLVFIEQQEICAGVKNHGDLAQSLLGWLGLAGLVLLEAVDVDARRVGHGLLRQPTRLAQGDQAWVLTKLRAAICWWPLIALRAGYACTLTT